MAFDLKSIKPTRRDVPPRILIHGQHKVGKSTWAAGAPGAIFIPTEDGQDAVDSSAFPLCNSWQDILDCITTLYSEPHEFLSVVLDSADWAEKLVHKSVCKDHDKSGIEDFGYGKGYVYASDVFRELLDGLNALREKRNMQVIMIAHSEIKRFDDPLADSYDRYQIKMHKNIGKLCQEWADVIGFAQLDTLTRTEELGFDKKKTRAVDTGQRVLRLSPSAAYDAGNRFGLPPSLPLNYSAFEEAFKNKGTGENNG